MNKLENKAISLIESQKASMLNVDLPEQGKLKLIIAPHGCNMEDIRGIARSLCDGLHEPVAIVKRYDADKRGKLRYGQYKLIETMFPSVQARLIQSGYGSDGKLGNLPDALGEVWGLLSIGITIVQHNRKIAFINQTAKRILHSNKILKENFEGLCLRRGNTVAQSIERCRRTQHTRSFELHTGNSVWQTTVLPISSHYSAVFMFCHQLSKRDCVLLSERYELTTGESKLIEQFVKNPEIADVAKKLSISVSTVRTILRSIFDKTGANNQQRLMRLLLTNSTISFSDRVKNRHRIMKRKKPNKDDKTIW